MTNTPRQPTAAETTLIDELNRAEAGDVKTAREVLLDIALLLSTRNAHPQTGEPLPVPIYVRDYLARAFGRMAAGEDPRKALHMFGKARSWSREDRMRGADAVAQLIEQGETVEKAVELAEQAIAQWQQEPHGRRAAPFAGRKISAATLQTWYYELRKL